MNALDLVKAAKSATGDFGEFWKNITEFFVGLPDVFARFVYWDTDRLSNVGVDQDKRTGIVPATRNAIKGK